MSSRPHLTDVTLIEEDEAGRPQGVTRRLLAELGKRKVCRTAISYILVMWLNLQIGDVIFPMIGLPDWSLSLIIVIGVMGFPVVLILAWAFQVTPQGIILDDGTEPETKIDGKLDATVNLLLLVSSIALSILLLLQFFAEERAPLLTLATAEHSTGMVVSNLSFESATDESANRTMALGIHEELRHRLVNLTGIDVLPDVSKLDPDDHRRRLSLAGSLLLEGGTGHVLAHLIDLSAGRYLMSITFNVDVETTLAAETTAAERIVEEFSSTLFGKKTVPVTAGGGATDVPVDG